MNFVSEWFLTFLVNSIWEIAALVVVAVLCDQLLAGSSARKRHAIWVGALVLSFVLPAATGLLLAWSDLPSALSQQSPTLEPGTVIFPDLGATGSAASPSTISISGITGLTIAGLYLAFALYQTLRLLLAWRRTRQMSESSEPADLAPSIAGVVETCRGQFNVGQIPVLFSKKVSSPVTIGTRRPVVILPDAMRHETDVDLLVSAIGHELVHISRRDYLLNLLYEITLVPLSFHPAMRFVKRRIDHTRELCCDELVTRQLIKAEDYARSLVRLASSAAVLPRRTMTTVGMGDADDLEVRVMSLLKGSVARPNGRKYLLLGGLVAVIALGVAIGGFGFKIGVAEVSAQKTEKQEPCKEVGPNCPVVTRDNGENESFVREWRAKLAAEHPEFTPDQVNARIERELEARREGGWQIKQREDAVDQAKLAKEAQVPMEQAIQAAVTAHPGIVLESVLVRERGLPMYRIVVLDKDSTEGAVTFFLVNAQDGQIVKDENGKIRVRSPE